MQYISALFILSTIQLTAACTLQCLQFQHINGDYHASCGFTTIGNASKCELTEFNDVLFDANITPLIKVVTIQLNFREDVTRVDLRLTSVPLQKILVEVEKENFNITILYLVGKFEIPGRNWFKNFPNIKLLVLQSAFFPTGMPIFTDLKQVTRIYSDKTEIGGSNLVIGEDFVSRLHSLDYLYFRTERTSLLRTDNNANIFRELTALSYLNLYRISFSNVNPNILEEMVNLKAFLSVSAEISDLTFLEHPLVKYIEEINLAFNRVYFINVFGRFSRLTKLALYSNEVTNLVRSDFMGMKGLKELDLQSNRVRDMNDDVFHELRDVEKMNLISNQITTISSKQFEHLMQLSLVSLDDNLLICDCKLKWIAEINSQYGIEFEGECIDSVNAGKPIIDPTNYVTCTETLSLECFNRSITCRPNSRCVSFETTYTCVCIDGYEEMNGECIDINECASGNTECQHNCTNLPGTYECCAPGLKLDHTDTCIDQDECLVGIDGCSQECVNTAGSYFCECREGFELLNDSVTCVDIDECSQSDNGCVYSCANEVGSYQCLCPIGYLLDGMTCYDANNCTFEHTECQRYCSGLDGAFVCVCDVGFVYSVVDGMQRCVDIDECQNPQLCNQGCQNTQGSYACLCDAGSKYIHENQTCVDIDECSEGIDNCNSLEICINVEDSYNCACVHEYIVEGTDQCGILPSYAIYTIVGGVIAIIITIAMVMSIICCIVMFNRKRRMRRIEKMNKAIYKEVSLQKAARHTTAYDPVTYLDNGEKDESRPSTAAEYERMNECHIYDSIRNINENNESIDSGTKLVNSFH
ncbi:Multiple epidermal growth factor-like domains protein 6 isoform X2 [Oopsacas minuta]|uniref:Multiple epidermal growth factor-like domains protein 6 isoform X2 n=1 Tax=Oopsacas minuta TaxID=111878 RepID=A0AAV7JTW3_9METZ|nr:Multiple epidermal growth factor-like domains protein 6 isoform X2 [Oopsacas minuta]